MTIKPKKYWWPKFICNLFYHRFGFKTRKCVRCGINFMKADGSITSSEYDD